MIQKKINRESYNEALRTIEYYDKHPEIKWEEQKLEYRWAQVIIERYEYTHYRNTKKRYSATRYRELWENAELKIVGYEELILWLSNRNPTCKSLIHEYYEIIEGRL